MRPIRARFQSNRRELFGYSARFASIAAAGAAGVGSISAAMAQNATPGAAGPPMAAGATPMTGADPLAGLPLTKDMEAVLRELLAFGSPPIPSLSAGQARQLPGPPDAVVALLAKRGQSTAPEMVGSITHMVVPGKAPEGVLVRIYSPSSGAGPFPVITYFHGGGWVISGLNGYDASCRALCNAAQAVVVSVSYRLAPENKFSAAVDDAYAATQWVIGNADKIKGDPRRVAVVGESAGGNLATVVCMKARDEGGAMPVHQALVYPITNDNFETQSYQQYANAVPLSKAMMQWFWQRYLTTPSDGANAYASPLESTNLKGLPPATVIQAEIDPLQSEGAAYADKLIQAGIDVRRELYKGVTHEFFGMGAVIPEAKQAVMFVSQRLQTAFGSSPASATPTS